MYRKTSILEKEWCRILSPLPTKTGDGIDLEDKEFLEFLAEFEDTGDFSLQ